MIDGIPELIIVVDGVPIGRFSRVIFCEAGSKLYVWHDDEKRYVIPPLVREAHTRQTKSELPVHLL